MPERRSPAGDTAQLRMRGRRWRRVIDSADEPGVESQASGTAVVCDPNTVNLRFLRAAVQKLGFDDVVTTKNVAELVAQATAHQPALVVFDPAMNGGAGIDAIEHLRRGAPEALIVGFCSDAELSAAARAMGLVTVAKLNMLQLDELVATVEEKLGRAVKAGGEEIPVADMDTPVWDLVPSLPDPEPDPE